MKKIALEAWEKNKGAIRSYIENKYNDFNPLESPAAFLGDILNIAYKEENAPTGIYSRTNKVKFIKIGKFRVMFFELFTKGRKQPTVILTKYSVLSFEDHPNISIDKKCDIARQIVLSATPIDIANWPKEWAEEAKGLEWDGFILHRGIIT